MVIPTRVNKYGRSLFNYMKRTMFGCSQVMITVSTYFSDYLIIAHNTSEYLIIAQNISEYLRITQNSSE